MEARGQDKDIGMPNLSLSNKREKSTAPTRPTQTLDPPPPPDPLTSAAEINTHSPPTPPPPPDGGDSVRYKECLKNHAVSMGGHVLDGCGEFMPSGDDGTPRALRCAACDCHRNFHRKEVGGHTLPSHSYRQTHLQQQQQPSHAYPTMVSFGGNSGGAAAESSSEDLNMFQRGAAAPSYSGSRKRFRTKFSTDQKDRMHEFARKLGWRMQKEDEQQVQDFCRQIGVKREVFKVWMHNNKQAIKKSSSDN